MPSGRTSAKREPRKQTFQTNRPRRQPALSGAGGLGILPRQGEVAGPRQTEGEVRENLRSVSSPSVTFGDTSPWRGRIEGLSIVKGKPYEEKKPNLLPSLKGGGWGWVGFRIPERERLKLADPPPTPPFQGGENARQRIPLHPNPP